MFVPSCCAWGVQLSVDPFAWVQWCLMFFYPNLQVMVGVSMSGTTHPTPHINTTMYQNVHAAHNQASVEPHTQTRMHHALVHTCADTQPHHLHPCLHRKMYKLIEQCHSCRTRLWTTHQLSRISLERSRSPSPRQSSTWLYRSLSRESLCRWKLRGRTVYVTMLPTDWPFNLVYPSKSRASVLG